MEKKGLTITIIFLAESANYGESIGNVATLKKISRNRGEQYTYISRQAIRYNIIDQLEEKKSPVSKEKGVFQFKDEALDIDIKHYIISLIRVHERLENINSTKEHILAILLGKENINEVLLKQTINGLRYNDINANFLPDGETKKNIIKDIDRLDNIEISQSYDDICLRLKLKNELTRDEILQIDTFESNRAQLFGNIADALSDELKRLNGNLIIKSLCLSLLMFLISFWLFYAGYKIYVWLNSLKKLNHKMKLIKDEILQTEDKSPQNLIEDFIVLYKELLQKYEQERSFAAIKDRLLVRLSKKFYLSKEQILSSVATLKKDENVVKNELVFENLEKNSQIIAINYSNIKGLLDRKNSDIGLNVKPFNPQILFSNILEAQAKRESAILVAEGEKQAAILRAEAKKEQAIKEAEGEAEAILSIQRAKAEALRLLNEAKPTPEVLSLKGMEAFERVADGQATKIIVPANFQNLASTITAFAELNEKSEMTGKN